MRRALLALVAAGAVLAMSAPAHAASLPGSAVFASTCFFSHSSNDDPIVFPSRPGLSHRHDFFGNAHTNAFSSYESLTTPPESDLPPTSCLRPQDTAAYWVPELGIRKGQRRAPSISTVYYDNGGKQPNEVKPFPPGLKMIGGNSMSRQAQPLSVTSWRCSGRPSTAPSSEIPRRCNSGSLELRVRFPDCWDGVNLDSTDHRSHMAYGVPGFEAFYNTCPASHPVPVPSLEVRVLYSVKGGRGLVLSSGSEHTGHADFVNAWHQDELERLVRDCINASRACGKGLPTVRY